jgi:ribosome biogenesis GTPase A
MRKDAVIMINKCDLVPPGVTRAWVEYFEKEMSGVPAVAFYTPKSMSGVVGQPLVEQFLDVVKRCKVPKP